MTLNIAIDGTAGSGKGTISDILAKKLGAYHLDTGAIYRTVAYNTVKKGIDAKNEQAVCSLLDDMDICIKFENGKQVNILANEDLGDKIRTPQISNLASVVSVYEKVREFATHIQHSLAKKYNLIVEGRDIGTVVLPNANYKFFLTADPQTRAKRRMSQLGLSESFFKETLNDIKQRDKRDMEREISPLKIASDAVCIDNSNQTVEETINLMLSYIK